MSFSISRMGTPSLKITSKCVPSVTPPAWAVVSGSGVDLPLSKGMHSNRKYLLKRKMLNKKKTLLMATQIKKAIKHSSNSDPPRRPRAWDKLQALAYARRDKVLRPAKGWLVEHQPPPQTAFRHKQHENPNSNWGVLGENYNPHQP